MEVQLACGLQTGLMPLSHSKTSLVVPFVSTRGLREALDNGQPQLSSENVHLRGLGTVDASKHSMT